MKFENQEGGSAVTIILLVAIVIILFFVFRGNKDAADDMEVEGEVAEEVMVEDTMPVFGEEATTPAVETSVEAGTTVETTTVETTTVTQ